MPIRSRSFQSIAAKVAVGEEGARYKNEYVALFGLHGGGGGGDISGQATWFE